MTAKSRNQAKLIDLAEYIPQVFRAEDTAEIRFEALSESNAIAINELFQSVFGVERTPEHHRWKFFDNPDGSGVACVAIERASGRVIGVNAGLNWRFWIEGREVRFLQTCETAIEPQHRGLRLFRQVTADLALRAVDRGMLLAYGGQINETAFKLGKLVFGYHLLFELTTWERRLSIRPAMRNRIGGLGSLAARAVALLRRPKPAPEEGGFQFERITSFGPQFDSLWRKLRGRYSVARVRDARALNHRFRDCPVGEHRVWLALRNGDPCGYVVTRFWEHDGVRLATVLDWLDGKETKLATALFSRALRDASQCGRDFFRVAPLPESSGLAAVAGLPGFAPSPREPVDRVVACLMPLEDPRDPEHAYLGSAFDHASWHYTQGDSDFHD